MFRLGLVLGVVWLTLSAALAALEAQVPTPGDFVVLSHSAVNLRAGPGLDTPIIGRADKGTLFPLAGEAGEWYEIRLFSGVPRYVSRSLCYHLTPDQIIPGHRLELPSTQDSAKVPAIVAGEVEPVLGIAMIPTGNPALANARAASIPSMSCARGAIVQISRESGGRWRIVATSPATTAAISTA